MHSSNDQNPKNYQICQSLIREGRHFKKTSFSLYMVEFLKADVKIFVFFLCHIAGLDNMSISNEGSEVEFESDACDSGSKLSGEVLKQFYFIFSKFFSIFKCFSKVRKDHTNP